MRNPQLIILGCFALLSLKGSLTAGILQESKHSFQPVNDDKVGTFCFDWLFWGICLHSIFVITKIFVNGRTSKEHSTLERLEHKF
jgi:hypothetical protein